MVMIWDAESGDMVAGPMKGHTDEVRSVAFSPDGDRIVSGSSDKTMRVPDDERAETILIIEGHTDNVNSVAYSPDGKLIVSGSDDDNTVWIWDSKTSNTVLGPIEGHEYAICCVSFSPDVLDSDETIRIWDVQSGRAVKGPFEGHTDAFNKLITYSPVGKHTVSGSSDKTFLVRT